MPRKTLHDIAVEYVRETAKAMCFNDGTKDFWVPKSLIGEDAMLQLEGKDDGTFMLTGPESWFLNEGLI